VRRCLRGDPHRHPAPPFRGLKTTQSCPCLKSYINTSSYCKCSCATPRTHIVSAPKAEDIHRHTMLRLKHTIVALCGAGQRENLKKHRCDVSNRAFRRACMSSLFHSGLQKRTRPEEHSSNSNEGTRSGSPVELRNMGSNLMHVCAERTHNALTWTLQ